MRWRSWNLVAHVLAAARDVAAPAATARAGCCSEPSWRTCQWIRPWNWDCREGRWSPAAPGASAGASCWRWPGPARRARPATARGRRRRRTEPGAQGDRWQPPRREGGRLRPRRGRRGSGAGQGAVRPRSIIVVNNAGAISHIPFAELPSTEWQRIIDTNLTGAPLVIGRAPCRCCAGAASIVNVGSRVAIVGHPAARPLHRRQGRPGRADPVAGQGARRAGASASTSSRPASSRPRTCASCPRTAQGERYKQHDPRSAGSAPPRRSRAWCSSSPATCPRFVTGETINVDGGIS